MIFKMNRSKIMTHSKKQRNFHQHDHIHSKNFNQCIWSMDSGRCIKSFFFSDEVKPLKCDSIARVRQRHFWDETVKLPKEVQNISRIKKKLGCFYGRPSQSTILAWMTKWVRLYTLQLNINLNLYLYNCN